jgi:hypothetical protein
VQRYALHYNVLLYYKSCNALHDECAVEGHIALLPCGSSVVTTEMTICSLSGLRGKVIVPCSKNRGGEKVLCSEAHTGSGLTQNTYFKYFWK